MSIIIHYRNKQKSTSGILRIRGMEATVSISSDGHLQSDTTASALFRVLIVNGTPLVQAECTELEISGTPLSRGTRIHLNNGLRMSTGALSLQAYSFLRESEALAYSDTDLRAFTPKNENPLGVAARFGHLSQEIPLLSGAQVSVGSDINDSLVLRWEGIEPTHCRLQRGDRDTAIVTALRNVRLLKKGVSVYSVEKGELSSNGQKLVLHRGDGLLLEPAGVAVTIR
jgi:hypothetical protein